MRVNHGHSVPSRLPSWADPRSGPGRTVLLSLAMATMGALFGIYSLRWGAQPAPLKLYFWELVPAVIAADELGFHLEVRGEAYTFTLSEVPLVLGCLFAAPWAVLLARLVGGLAFQLVRRKQVGVKLTFNLALWLLETVSTIVLVHTLVAGRSPVDWVTWPLVIISVVYADTLSACAVSCAIRWHGGEPQMTPVAVTVAITALVNVNLALLAAVVLWERAPAIVLLLVVLVMTSVAYRAYTSLSKRYANLKQLYDFTKVAGASMGAEAVLDQMLSKARDLMMAEVAEVVLFDRADGRPSLRQRNTDQGDGTGLVPIDPSDPEVAWAEPVRDGRAFFVTRNQRSSAHSVTRDELGVRDFVAAPLWADDSVAGAIMVAGRLGSINTFGEEDCRLFETLANHASIAIENSRLLEQLRQEAEDRRYEALHDALTGLPNRALFTQEVDAVMTTGTTSAVLLMDLDRFKEVNDTLGHHIGDILLGEVARRLAASLPAGATAARLGGDEFAILLPDVTNLTAEHVADQVLEAFQWPCVLDELSIEIGASIGIALAPFHGKDAATLLQRADVAMYEAKFSRRGRQTYSAERDTYSPRRLALLAELRQAIDDGHILVYFQPKARLADGHVLGVEALVRWQHPDHGLLPPDEFVPVVEHTGLISPLTTYVLRSALQQCARWRDAGKDLGVAVNIAVRSLLDVELPQAVNDLLTETKVPPDRLTLEITESGIMADPKRAIAVLQGLAASGIRLSVDDFGTGYSSLTYLQRLPVHEVKVDKSFVFGVATDTADTVIVQSIVDLGHNLGLKVVAEGVEDEATWRRLCDMTCDVAQGYYLSRPMTAAALGTWLDERQRASLTMAVPDLSAGGALPGRARETARTRSAG